MAGASAQLTWEPHGGDTTAIAVERRMGDRGSWERVVKLPAGAKEYTDSRLSKSPIVSYRVRALNDAGESAYSNIVRIRM